MNSTSLLDFTIDRNGESDWPSTATSYLAPTIKTAIVNTLAAVPSYRTQTTLAAVVRFLWPGFRGA